MKSILLLLFLAVHSLLFSQTNFDKTIRLDSSRNVTSGAATYYRVIKDYTTDKPTYQIEEYTKSGQILMSGNSLKRDEIVKTGNFIYYHENGQKKQSITYSDALAVGKFSSWHKNGTKHIEGEYLKNYKNPKEEGIFKIDQFWNPDEIQSVVDGEGVYENKEEDFSEKGQIKKGLRFGEWSGTCKIPKLSYIEFYQDGTLVKGESTNENGEKFTYEKILDRPEPIGGYKAFYSYVGKNYRIKNINQIVDGRIYMRFVIDQTGAIDEISITKGIGDYFDKEAIRVLKEYKGWKPGKKRGIKTKVSYSMPLAIKVN